MTDEEYIRSKEYDHSKHICPVCEPHRDPLTEIIIPWYCGEHAPSLSGAADPPLSTSYHLPIGDAEGETQRDWCNFIHRKELPS